MLEDGNASADSKESLGIDGSVQEVLDAVRGTGFFRREVEDVEGDRVAGGDVLVDGFTEEEGVGGSGEEGHVETTCSE